MRVALQGEWLGSVPRVVSRAPRARRRRGVARYRQLVAAVTTAVVASGGEGGIG